MVKVYNATSSDLPAGIRHTSSFARDESCTEVHFFIADTFDEAWTILDSLLAADDTLVDGDANFDTAFGKWVGVTCR